MTPREIFSQIYNILVEHAGASNTADTKETLGLVESSDDVSKTTLWTTTVSMRPQSGRPSLRKSVSFSRSSPTGTLGATNPSRSQRYP